jgi:hypothetical protein
MNVNQYFRRPVLKKEIEILLPNQVNNLAVWYDVDDFSTLTFNGGNVSQINDKSGNSRHATQSTAASQPLYVENVKNSKPALQFDGTDDWLQSAFTLSGYPVSMFLVSKRISGLGYHTSFALSGNGIRYMHQLIAEATITRAGTQLRTGSGDVALNGQFDILDTQKFTVTASFFTADKAQLITERSNLSQNHSLPYENNNILFLGRLRNASSGLFGNCQICEFFMYNGEPKTDEKTKLLNYLQQKYNINLLLS